MPRISSYPLDTNISGTDSFFGVDADEGQTNKRFTVTDLARYYRNSGELGLGTSEFNQVSASNIWTITHNLERFPSVTVVDSSGNLVIGDVDYISNLELTITFSAPFSGTAYLN